MKIIYITPYVIYISNSNIRTEVDLYFIHISLHVMQKCIQFVEELLSLKSH
jgi:hypothetical protein